MAGGFGVTSPGGEDFEAKITPIVVISCILAASGGLMFGYDIGISVYKRQQVPGLNSNYCKYDNQYLQLFTSSLYLAALTASFFASYTTRKLGRKLTMLVAGIFFCVGTIFNAAAQNLAMLIIGRLLLGCGVGFGNQNILCRDRVTGGWGWRLSLGLAAVPSVLLTIGALVVVDTPNSLIERGKLEQGKAVLKRIRGVQNVDPEFLELLEASRTAQEVKNPFRNLLKRKNRPQLIITVFLQFFQQFTGINAINFYAPVLFQTLGFKSDASLYSAVITGSCMVVGAIISIYLADRAGRRVLLLEGAIQMLVSHVGVTIILGLKLKETTSSLDRGMAILVVVLVCSFVGSFGWSWGPLAWLIASEIFPLETRSAGQSVTVGVNMFFTFVIAQAFLSMLCHLKFGIFLFFGVFVFIMFLFVLFLLPETKGVPIEEMTDVVWRQHWFWRRFIEDDYDDEPKGEGYA
ncbi:hypothetical protein ACLB2K_041933 [Fragaria x ananassa]